MTKTYQFFHPKEVHPKQWRVVGVQNITHPMPRKPEWRTLGPERSKLRSCQPSCTSQNEQDECETLSKKVEYKDMEYVNFKPITDLEKEIFSKCSINQPPMSYPSPLKVSDKLTPCSKTTYSNVTHWFQQSQSNVDKFWKDDIALVKTLRQYHFASNVLEGHTQWKFQKYRILHQVIDVIAIHLEGMNRCLDFHGTTPVDQGFRHCVLNLHCLKAMALKEVKHLMMVIMLDKDHIHYSDTFGNVFKEDTLHRK